MLSYRTLTLFTKSSMRLCNSSLCQGTFNLHFLHHLLLYFQNLDGINKLYETVEEAIDFIDSTRVVSLHSFDGSAKIRVLISANNCYYTFLCMWVYRSIAARQRQVRVLRKKRRFASQSHSVYERD